MSVSSIFSRAGKILIDNSPALLTAIGVTGAVTTAILAGKASFKAAEVISRREAALEDKLETKEKVETVWKLYIPAASSLVLTGAAIIMANRIGTRRAAALATAYKLSEEAFTTYREKIVEKMGAAKEEKARAEIAQERINEHPPINREVIIAGGDVLCLDLISGRYFRSTKDLLLRAENKINHQIMHNFYASLTDLYNEIGLPKTSISDELGWNSSLKLLELRFSAVLTGNGEPCLAFDFSVDPIRDYYQMCG